MMNCRCPGRSKLVQKVDRISNFPAKAISPQSEYSSSAPYASAMRRKITPAVTGGGRDVGVGGCSGVTTRARGATGRIVEQAWIDATSAVAIATPRSPITIRETYNGHELACRW